MHQTDSSLKTVDTKRVVLVQKIATLSFDLMTTKFLSVGVRIWKSFEFSSQEVVTNNSSSSFFCFSTIFDQIFQQIPFLRTEASKFQTLFRKACGNTNVYKQRLPQISKMLVNHRSLHHHNSQRAFKSKIGELGKNYI